MSEAGSLAVPLQMMDKAFKNKKNKYQLDGVATLRFAIVAEEGGNGQAHV